MATIRGLTLQINGDTTSLDKSLSGINSRSKELQTELRQIDRLLKLDPSNTELLAQKQAVLAAAIENSTQKEMALKDAEKQVQQQFAEGKVSEEQLRALQREVIKASQETDKFGDQAEDAMQKAEKGTDSLGEAVRGLTSMLGVNLPPALDNATKKLDGISASGAALVGGIAAVGIALGKTTIETSKLADDLLTLSSTTGITTTRLQEMNYASELLDVSTETMTGSMTKMIRNMANARDGSKQQAEAFAKLRIRVQEGNGELRDSNEVFYEVIDRLGKMRNETERDAISMQIFGRSARDLNPLIEAGSEAMKGFAQEAHEVGYVIDEEALDRFGRLDDAMQRLEKKGDALKNSFAEALLPLLTRLFEVIGAIPTPVLTLMITLVPPYCWR